MARSLSPSLGLFSFFICIIPFHFFFSTIVLAFPVHQQEHHQHHIAATHDYRDALSMSILFFEGQRSGKLPLNQRLKWRRDSGLYDGAEMHVRTP